MLTNIYGRIIQEYERKRLCNEIVANIRISGRIFHADLNICINIPGSELNLHSLDLVRIGIIDREFNLRIGFFWAEWEEVRTVEHTRGGFAYYEHEYLGYGEVLQHYVK